MLARSLAEVSPVRTQVRIWNCGRPKLLKLFLNALQRLLQVALNVIAESLQRRNVNNVRLVLQFPGDAALHEIIDRRKKGRECFSRAGRSGNQSVMAVCNRGPGSSLRFRGFSKLFREPIPNSWVKVINRHVEDYNGSSKTRGGITSRLKLQRQGTSHAEEVKEVVVIAA